MHDYTVLNHIIFMLYNILCYITYYVYTSRTAYGKYRKIIHNFSIISLGYVMHILFLCMH